MTPNDADRIANSVNPDQSAPLGAVWSGSALFAQAYLSENLISLRYTGNFKPWSQNPEFASVLHANLLIRKSVSLAMTFRRKV